MSDTVIADEAHELALFRESAREFFRREVTPNEER